ncbi:MAG TPA: Na+/H+ antiporter NhaA, partial [Alphaproteobacteria bacterium]
DFIAHEAAAGLCLMVTAAFALLFANLPFLQDFYAQVTTPSIMLVVNDGLMTLFFLLVGLELKREIVAGELSSRQRLLQPLFAAIGGMVVPSLIFAGFNWHDPSYLRGWAIPAATDIAFALGILSLFGKRIPKEIKILLTAIAILDDLGAILVIAFFYTDHLNPDFIPPVIASLAALWLLNKRNAQNLIWYLIVGFAVWISFLRIGIHPTLAGVILAFAVPMRNQKGASSHMAPLYRLEHHLHPYVGFLVLPVFAFVNAGLSLHGLNGSMLGHSLTLGVLFGLLLGKPLGIMGGLLLGHMTGVAPKDVQASWGGYLVMACLCGIGFTMALFVGDLAFDDVVVRDLVKLGILLGSLGAVLAAVIGARNIRPGKIKY